ncbi:MAG: nucleoside-diphosphate kinase, partial [Lentisphaeria bacterium]|nr:nucleoside-diphosphate kinase [Lentisphaeria bacterium]
MAVEVSYVIITPYTLLKSRTGGIVARLMSRTDLEFIGAQVLAFTPGFADAYASNLEEMKKNTPFAKTGKLLADYVRENFVPGEDGKAERSMILLFKGEDACAKLTSIVGRLTSHDDVIVDRGETLRDTYADLVEDKENPGKLRYFEPAVLTPPDMNEAIPKLKLFQKFASESANIIDNSVGSCSEDERTLVIIKPDNWRHPSSRPGNIIDMLSRTGLRIVGCKVHRMSIDDALEFYGPVQGALRSKLAPKIGSKAKDMLEENFGVTLPDDAVEHLTQAVGIPFADDQFSQIIEFMSGRRPEGTTPEERKAQNNEAKCLVLIYEGPNAISK